MAKIYETKEDVQRDALKEQARGLRADSKSNFLLGTLNAAASVMWYAASLIGKSRGERNMGNKVLTSLTGATAGIAWMESWKERGQAKLLESQLSNLGPETVILPPDVAKEKPCSCKLKHSPRPIEPKTLIEQAKPAEAEAIASR